MARINNRPATQPADTRRGVAQPDSDQENRAPNAADKTTRRDTVASLNGDGQEGRGSKRRRLDQLGSQTQRDSGSNSTERFNKYFDPNQDADERREIKKKSRALAQDFQERRDAYLRDSTGEGLQATVQRADNLFRKVKQTGDATMDSRLLVNVSDVAYKKASRLTVGDTSTGIDVDEFLSKCISYMRNGGPLDADGPEATQRATQHRRTATQRRRHTDDEDVDDDDDSAPNELDWEILGRHACFPYNRRPAVPSFLLGPLSVEKKIRVHTQRRARQADKSTEARPVELSRTDMQSAEADETGLTAICKRIHSHLAKHNARAERALSEQVSEPEELQTPRGRALLKKYRVSRTGGPTLFEYVINPRSFAQTVENLFYVSFLIKEGNVGIVQDDQGMPTLMAVEPTSLEEQRATKVTKHQAVFTLDYATWQQLIEAFEIKESMIPARSDEGPALGANGWYT